MGHILFPTMKLRYIKRRVSVPPVALGDTKGYYKLKPILQQLFEETTGKQKWIDVPVEEPEVEEN